MRITKVTTKKGDDGRTELGDGTRVSKSDIIIRTIGQIDELNSFIGLAKADSDNKIFINKLSDIQNQLLNLGGELSVPNKKLGLINDESISHIEADIIELNKKLPPLKEFIIPGEDELSARLHVARAICRKAESMVTEIVERSKGKDFWIKYLNRLSDYLFILARHHVNEIGISEKQWNRSK